MPGRWRLHRCPWKAAVTDKLHSERKERSRHDNGPASLLRGRCVSASAGVLEKNGFVCEGHLRKHYLKDGRFFDGKLYALVR